MTNYQHIHIHLQYHNHGTTGEETMFKIKKSTKMSKVFKAYASRKGVEESALRFLLDGERISDTDTPKMLELEDEDQIDCVLQQVGGASDDEGGGGDAKPEGGNEPITIRVSECIYFGVCVCVMRYKVTYQHDCVIFLFLLMMLMISNIYHSHYI